MKQTEAIKLARIDSERQTRNTALQTLNTVVANPMFALVAGVVTVEMLQRYPKDSPVLSGTVGNWIEAAMITPGFLTSLGEFAKGLGGVASIATLLAK